MCFRSIISIFGLGHVLVGLNFQNFLKNLHFYVFCEEINVEYSGHRRGVKLADVKKLILYLFRSVKIGCFSYCSHENLIRARWDRVCEKNFQIFHLWAVFLTKYFTCTVEAFLWKQQSAENIFFQQSIFSTEGTDRSIQC